MKVLIITYYWCPAGGSGVQRWLKFAKYLTDFGITPIIYAPENANYPTIDEKLAEEVPNVEVIKQPIFNPQDLLPKKKQKSGVANINKGGFLSWIRGNFFIPDAKIFWVKPSVKFLEKYIKNHNIDVIISSGPPHSMHLIAEKLKQKTKVKWIADFRDPWTTLYYAKDFNLSNYAKRKNQKLEENVLQNADVVLTVSKTIKEELKQKANRVEIISNGYDNEVLNISNQLDNKFSISHIGLLPRQSNPKILWEVLQEISTENKQFKKDLEISLTGNVSEETISEISKNKLENNLKLNGYVSHKKAIELQKQAQILLLLIPKTKNSKGILTGKVFEYITSNRPILAIGDEKGDLAEILSETKTGILIDFEDKTKLKSVILDFYNEYLQGKLKVTPQNIEQYHRKKLTEKLSKIINKL
ncbi:MAG: glycosyltransferase family 4 protein [Tenacibaculum sp.]|nr:glycosyltransferase family 4 protein [Tenacibaculum sp.]